MNKATVLFASTTVLLAALSMYLGRALHTERTRPDQTDNAAPLQVRTSEQPSAPPVAVQQSRAETADSRPAKAQASSVAKDKSERSTRPAYRKRLTHQTHREAQLAYARLELERQFPELATVLNLQPDEAGRFFDLLAKQQTSDADFENSFYKRDGVREPPDPRERDRQREARQQAHRSEQAALLGDAKMAEWNQYLNSMGARTQVRELRTLLADSDYPLRGYQYEPLVAALAAEHQRHNAEREQLRLGQRDQNNPTNEEVIEYMGERLDLIEESLARRRQVAQLHLDSEQLRRYDSMLELERRRAQVEHDAFVTLNAEAAEAKKRVRR